MKKIGFIGGGIMGKSMMRNLLKAGFEVQVYTRTKSKVEDLISEGAVWKDSPALCAIDCDAVITIVGYPRDVEEVYFGKDGIFDGAAPGTYLIDMTTSSPKLAQRIYETAREKGMYALDAPVTGGDTGARAGTLTILVGGDRKDYEACIPVFEAMGKKLCYEGASGNGQHVKMCNQIAIAGTLAGACEAIAYARKVGVDPKTMLGDISEGAAGSFQMSNVASRALNGDYAPGFFLKHFIKDLSIAQSESADRETILPVLDEVLELCKDLEKEGNGDCGTQVLVKHYLS